MKNAIWVLLLSLMAGSSTLLGQSRSDLVTYDSLYQMAEGYPDDSIARKSWLYHQAGREASAAGELETAVAATQRALDLRLSDEEQFSNEVLISAFNIGSYLSILGEYRRGLEYYSMVTKRAPNKKEGAALFQIGFNYGAMGEFSAGVSAMSAAARLPPFVDDDYTNGLLKMELAHLHIRKSNRDASLQAIPILKEAMVLFDGFDETDYEQMLCLNYLGWAYTEAGDYQQAIEELFKAESIARDLEIRDEDLSAIYANLGLANRRANRPNEALTYYRKAIAVEQSLEDNGRPNSSIATFMDNISTAELALGRPDSALYYASEALRWSLADYAPATLNENPDLKLLNKEPLELLIFLQDKALAHFALGRNGQKEHFTWALNTYRLADELLDQLRRDQLLEDTRNYWRADARTLYGSALNVAVAARDPGAAFYFMEKARARLLLDELSAGRANERLPELVQQRLAAAARQTRQSGNDPIILQRFRQLQDSIFKAYPAYEQARIGAAPPDPDKLKDILHGTTLVEYFVAEERTIALVWSAASGLRLVELAPPGKWRQQLKAFLQEAANPYQELSAQNGLLLYNQLIAPLDLPAGTPVTIVPDGELYLLPFGALITREPAPGTDYNRWPWLASERSLNYAFSVQLLDFARTRRGRGNGRVLALAPVARLGPNDALKPSFELPATLRTIRHLSGLFPSDTLVNAAANRIAFRQMADAYSLLHLGTHAYLEAEGSFLLHDSLQPYYTMADLAEHQLQADLVVMGACETGLGEQLPGEGVASLARGFARRGAPSLIMSLWSIDDATTADLLNLTYDGLYQKAGPATALYEAGMAYRAGVTNPNFGHPYYWAGLVYYGPDIPLAIASGNGVSWWAWGLVVVALAALLIGLRRRR